MTSFGKFEIVEKVYSSLTEVILAQNFMGANIACTFLTSTVCFNPNGWSDSEQFWKAFRSWFITLQPASKHLRKLTGQLFSR